MKSIYLKAGKAQDVFNELKKNLTGRLTSNNGEYNLALESDFVKGNIEGMTFQEGMTYMQFEIVFSDDVILSIESYKTSPIFFAYCSEGSMMHSFGVNGDKKHLKKYNSGVLKSTSSINSILYFEKNIPIKFSIIGIGTSAISNVQNDNLIHKLKKTFLKRKDDYVDIRFRNFKIDEKIKEFNSITQTGIVRNLLKKGILQIILAMEIEQHTDSFVKVSEAITCLTLKQIEEIKRISNFIMNFPAEQFTIKFLTQKTGLSPYKLQEGFKLVHSRTVNDFITFMRIEKAENLIRTSDLNISEIVYAIGFTSRSYFSKIFKQKYNCSPKDYKYNQNSIAKTA
ncbi:helix-turn-helix transcriptional regulator [Flavobacterium sp. ALJ2]|uniref:helix-turn-helix domain-containing protein n=1 Tax=Flavobacterium sp. ALJ2 TaxID=2786960 RepID=UPI0018A0F167|nr:AraC family transcriptional regulator [Flavobacterium sp. ALJ2]MBF7091511.1 helix-turn-helix transcriptional regulator [Flavobacterium sp. ALJ2]